MLSSTFSPYQNQLYSDRLRQPRAIVLINNLAVAWTEIQIQTATFYVADSYNVSIPLTQPNPAFNMDFWATNVDMSIKIFVGFPSNPNAYGTGDLKLMIQGDVDMLEIDPLSQMIHISGRDLTSRLIDTKTTQKYANMSASQIATALAQKHGLIPNITQTSGNVGNLYNNQQVTMTKSTTEWDLITYLAQQIGYVVYVDRGNYLNFVPYPTPSPDKAYVIQYQPPASTGLSPTFNGMDLQLKRSLTLARDVKVIVRVPHGAQNGGAFTVSAQATRRSRPYLRSNTGTTAPSQTYSFIRAGLTKQQAQQFANQMLSNITLHEVIMDVALPGDNALTKDSIIQLKGTNTSFDQYYYADIVTRTISYEAGYLMRVNAKNRSVDTQIAI